LTDEAPRSLGIASPPISLLAANEEVSAEELSAFLNAVRRDALFAKQWFEDLDNASGDVLKPIVDILATHNLVVGYDLEAKGFEVCEERGEIRFNGGALNSIVTAARSMQTRTTEGNEDLFVKLAIALYVYHEITHVDQKFIDHALAGKIKTALSPDQLSQFDCIADVNSAHCAALIACAYSDDFSEELYLKAYASNLLLSYQILVRAFGISSGDHKRKRALGLLTNTALTQIAINTDEGARKKAMMSLCIRPCFTGVVPETGEILCVTLGTDGLRVLFCATAATNAMDVESMWLAIGGHDPSEIIAVLRLAYERHESG
jgi:hypothetical protein